MHTAYLQNDSFLHRLNPLAKVLATVPVLVFVALTTDPWTPLTVLAINAVLLIGLGRVSPLRLARLTAPLLVLMIGFVMVYPFVVRRELVGDTPLLWAWGPIELYAGGLRFGLATALRVLCLITLSFPFSLTTDSSDFIRALVQQWRFPYRLGYSAMAAFRFVPMLQTELAVIAGAHRVRGLSDGGGLRAQYERFKRYAIPLLATAIRQAERTALAMDGRAFGAFPTRTYYKRMRFSTGDVVFVLGSWGVYALAIAGLAAGGWLGPLVLLQQV